MGNPNSMILRRADAVFRSSCGALSAETQRALFMAIENAPAVFEEFSHPGIVRRAISGEGESQLQLIVEAFAAQAPDLATIQLAKLTLIVALVTVYWRMVEKLEREPEAELDEDEAACAGFAAELSQLAPGSTVDDAYYRNLQLLHVDQPGTIH